MMSSHKILEANSIPIPPKLVGLLKKTLGKTGNGFDEGAFLQQLHYWTNNAQATGWIVDGGKWIYNSLKSWQQQFPWMTQYSLRKAITNLKRLGLIQTAQHWVSQYNRVMFYRIDYEQLTTFAPNLFAPVAFQCVDSDQVDVRSVHTTDPDTSSDTSFPKQQTAVASNAVLEDKHFELSNSKALLEQGTDPVMGVEDAPRTTIHIPSSGNNAKAQPVEFPELIDAVTAAIGRAPSKTLKQAIAQCPQRVRSAIAYLQQQQNKQQIKNLAGYLYRAITEEWDLTISEQSTIVIPNGFNQWFDWAKQQGWVIAAMAINGIHHTLHVQHGWLPTEQLMQLRQ